MAFPPALPRDVAARALQLFAAAFGALVLAAALGLTNPFWAAMPVWVVHQAFREDLVIRGLLRLLGTLVGAAAGIWALGQADAPILVALILGVTVGVSAGIARWMGQIYSYGALMTAITCGVIVLPGLVQGTEAVPLAIDRFWCTLIGVGMVTGITFAFTPRREGPHPAIARHLRQALPRGAVAGALALIGGFAAASLHSFPSMCFGLSLVVFGSILASMPDPTPVLKNLLPGAAMGVVAALVYRGGVTWAPDGAAVHLAFAAIFIAAGALMRAHPKTAGPGLDANMCFLLTAELGAERHGLSQVAMGGAMLLVAAGGVVLLWHAIFMSAARRA